MYLYVDFDDFVGKLMLLERRDLSKAGPRNLAIAKQSAEKAWWFKLARQTNWKRLQPQLNVFLCQFLQNAKSERV
jgi:hypothetical protein